MAISKAHRGFVGTVRPRADVARVMAAIEKGQELAGSFANAEALEG
jgi:hypothetical protein